MFVSVHLPKCAHVTGFKIKSVHILLGENYIPLQNFDSLICHCKTLFPLHVITFHKYFFLSLSSTPLDVSVTIFQNTQITLVFFLLHSLCCHLFFPSHLHRRLPPPTSLLSSHQVPIAISPPPPPASLISSSHLLLQAAS